jgi:hypothetical protein
MTKVVWGAGIRLAGAVVLVLTSASCGDLTRAGQSPSYLIINSLLGASGAEPSNFGGTLASDVITISKTGVAGIFADIGKASFQLGLKNPGPASSPTSPTSNNFITIDRYHVKYLRADGHNTQGVDVPYEFDSALTATVSSTTDVTFTLVPIQAKLEAPLKALGPNNIPIRTITYVTFYGHDQTGNGVSVTAQIGITFANFADPA